MARGKKRDEGVNFEASLKKLEEIVRRLEDEQVPLEESLRLFAEGKKLARGCEAELQRAENSVKQLIEDAEGNLAEEPLAADDAEAHDEARIMDSGAMKPDAPSGTKPKDDLPF